MKFYNEKELAQLLGLKPRTLQEWRTKKRGPKYIRISNNTVRYDAQDVEAWIKERKEKVS